MSKIKLTSIHLVNFATFENQEIHFGEKFNCIVGETGSGKSLILTAFLGLLGNRVDKKSIRKGAENAIIEGVFCIDNNLREKLNNDGYPSEANEVCIKRIISHSGTTKAYINGLVCSSTYLSNFIREFIDLVGQFENQKLLSPEYQLHLLDLYAQNEEVLNSYKTSFSKMREISNQLEELKIRESQQQERSEYLRFQIEEFDELNFSQKEEAELQNKRELAFNLEKNKNVFSQVFNILNDGESSLIDSISKLHKLINGFKGIENNHAAEVIERMSADAEHLEALLQNISSELDIDLDLDQIMSRLDQYQKIKRKHGAHFEDVLKKMDDYRIELSELQTIGPSIDKLTKEYSKIGQSTWELAKKLDASRKNAASKLSRLITDSIQLLNMSGAQFKIDLFTTESLNADGINNIQFAAETNKGEGIYPIKDIASGGELSRILLCLRQIISSKDSISIFFFDEIDTGIGGETAVKIANLLSQISLNSQVITITHLPQIAHSCDHIIHVSKQTIKSAEGPRTFSKAQLIEGENKKKVIEEMIAIN